MQNSRRLTGGYGTPRYNNIATWASRLGMAVLESRQNPTTAARGNSQG